MPNPEHGLLATDEDLAAWLARISAPPEPKSFDYQHTFAPDVQARINAQLQPPSIMPSQVQQNMPQQYRAGAELSLGPLSLGGGLSTVPTPEGGTRMAPNFGAGMTVPVGGGDASARFNITPEVMKQIELAWQRKLLGGDLDARFNYSQPDQGTPNWGARIGYSRRF